MSIQILSKVLRIMYSMLLSFLNWCNCANIILNLAVECRFWPISRLVRNSEAADECCSFMYKLFGFVTSVSRDAAERIFLFHRFGLRRHVEHCWRKASTGN